jgi:glycosyltransferase involved in cell wall biosynthesis
MKIAIDTLFEHPDHPSSAIDYLRNVAIALPKVDPAHSYYLLVSPRNRHHFDDISHANLHLVDCFVSNENRPLRIFVQQSVFPALMVRHRFDVLFSPGNVCPLVGSFCRVLKINTLHHYEAPELIGRTRSFYRKLAFSRSAKKANRIIANTERTREEICRLMGVPAEKVEVVPEALYDVFAPMPAEHTKSVCSWYGLNRDYVLFVSTLYPYKNPETLIRAFARLLAGSSLDYELVIVGRDYESRRAKLEALAATLRIANRTRLLGYVPTRDMPFLYSGARVFVYPSLKETFGKPIVEAMRCGVPVIASDIPCHREVLGDAGILVNPTNLEEISRALLQVISNKLLRNNLVTRGLERGEHFSWADAAKKTAAVLEEAKREWNTKQR